MVSSKLPTSVASTLLAAKPSTTATKASYCGATATGPAQRKGSGVDPSPPAERCPVDILLSFRTQPWSTWMKKAQHLGMQLWLIHACCLPGFTAGNGRQIFVIISWISFLQEIWLSFQVLARQMVPGQILIRAANTKKDFLLVEKWEAFYFSSWLSDYIHYYSWSIWRSFLRPCSEQVKVCPLLCHFEKLQAAECVFIAAPTRTKRAVNWSDSF